MTNEVYFEGINNEENVWNIIIGVVDRFLNNCRIFHRVNIKKIGLGYSRKTP